jgi:hypothetical protein
VACGEYAVKKLSVFKWHRQFKEGREDMKWPKKWAAKTV